MLKSWIKSLISKRTNRKSAHGNRVHLKVEQLELRDVPTVGIQNLILPVGVVEGTQTGGAVAVFTGNSANLNDYSASVAWGDGSTATTSAGTASIVDNFNGTYSVVANNTYAEEGNKTLTVNVTNALGGSATQSASVSVADAPLTGYYPAMLNAVPNTPLSASPIVIASFTDGNLNAPASDFTATIAWGDGTTSAGAVVADAYMPGQWNVMGNHTYATTGAFQATVTLNDVGSSTASVVTPIISANPSPLQVTPYDPATSLTTLTNALMNPGTGLNLVGSSFVGQNGQAGTYTGFNFHDQNTSLSLTDGILLTSGSAANAVGPNNQSGATTAYGTPADPMGNPLLDAMVAPDITYDANSLSLQFTAAQGVTSIQFQFVFGSEEFPEWVGLYNDVFAVFLDGKQISFDSASNPITVNNNFFQLNNSADTNYPAYTAGKTVVAYDIQYDGLTPALTTHAALDPTIATHTLTFAIADTRDQVLDSGVFITSLAGNGTGTGGTATSTAPQANAGGPVKVPAGQTIQLSASGTTSSTQNPSTLTYKWDLNGNNIFGETGAAATNGDEVGMNPTFVPNGLAPGTSVTVSLQVTDSNGVVSTDQAVITIAAPAPVTPPTTGGSVAIGQGPGGANTLLVYGTNGDDAIKVVPHGDKGDVSVIINGKSQGVYAKSSFSSIAVYGQDGNDVIQVDGDVKATAYLFGGQGNDVLTGGGGLNYLDGGAGNDKLSSGDGWGVLIGGAGADVLSAGNRGDLLIAGSIDYDTPSNLLALWNAPAKSYKDRAATVQSLLAGHVFDDGQKDVLNGGDGMNLYFFGTGDFLHDKKKSEIAILS